MTAGKVPSGTKDHRQEAKDSAENRTSLSHSVARLTASRPSMVIYNFLFSIDNWIKNWRSKCRKTGKEPRRAPDVSGLRSAEDGSGFVMGLRRDKQITEDG